MMSIPRTYRLSSLMTTVGLAGLYLATTTAVVTHSHHEHTASCGSFHTTPGRNAYSDSPPCPSRRTCPHGGQAHQSCDHEHASENDGPTRLCHRDKHDHVPRPGVPVHDDECLLCRHLVTPVTPAALVVLPIVAELTLESPVATVVLPDQLAVAAVRVRGPPAA